MSQLLFLQAEPRRLQWEDFASFAAKFWPVLVPAVLGLAAVYLLLPRVRRFPPRWGAVCGGLALVLAGALLIHAAPVLPETILFYAFAAVALGGGTLLVTHPNPVYAALAFALVVLSTSGLFLLLAAPFLMAATVIIYAGAIIVTFLFVIMLAQQAGLSAADMRSREPFLGTLAGFLLLGAIVCVLQRTYDASALDPYLARVEQAAHAKAKEEIARTLDGDADSFFKRFAAVVNPPNVETGQASSGRKLLVDEIHTTENVVLDPRESVSAKTAALRKLHALGLRVQYAQGTLAPAAGLPLSPFSGVQPNKAVALDPAGKLPERLPAENVAALGKSLFTDYLLAVELAGTLLLVATIGAITIAGRRAEGLR